MKKEKEIFSENDTPEVFSFSEKENEKQFLNEDYVFSFENNEPQEGNESNVEQLGIEENDNYINKEIEIEESERQENKESEKIKENQIASNSASSSAAASSGSGVIATVAATATAAVVVVVGGAIALGQTFEKPKICYFNDVVATDNSVYFNLAVGNDERLIHHGEETGECDLNVEITSPTIADYYNEYHISNYGMIEGQFLNLEPNTEYYLNVSQTMLLGTSKEYLLEEPYVIYTQGKEYIHVSSISFEEEFLELQVGEEYILNPIVLPENASDKSVVWDSNDETVIEVSEGILFARGPGEASVTATTTDGSYSASVEIYVCEEYVPVEGISLDVEQIEVDINDKYQINATIYPETATNPYIYWSSDNEEIAKVDEGLIIPVSTGSAVITATTEDGQYQATCYVSITGDYIAVEGIELSEGEISIELGSKEATVITANILPSEATNQSITWSLSKPSIIDMTVSEDTHQIELYGLEVGECVITAMCESIVIECYVYVDEPYIPVEGVSLNYTSLDMYVNTSETLVATVSPETASIKDVMWSSTDEEVVKVSDDGVVTAVGEGSASIVVTTYDGSMSASCEITTTIATPTFKDYFITKNITNSGNVIPSFLINYEDVSKVWNASFRVRIASGDMNGDILFEDTLVPIGDYYNSLAYEYRLYSPNLNDNVLATLEEHEDGTYKSYIIPASAEEFSEDTLIYTTTFYGFSNGVSPIDGSIIVDDPYFDEGADEFHIQFHIASNNYMNKFNAVNVRFTNEQSEQQYYLEGITLGDTITTEVPISLENQSYFVEVFGVTNDGEVTIISELISDFGIK